MMAAGMQAKKRPQTVSSLAWEETALLWKELSRQLLIGEMKK